MRVVHASPDAGPVDILVDGAEVAGDVEYSDLVPDNGDFVLVDPGSHRIQVTAPNDPGTSPIDATLDLPVATATTIVAANVAASIEPLVLDDDVRSVALYAKLRLVRAAPAAALVDVYLTGGDDITGEDPVLEDFPFGDETDYLPVAEGDYFVTITGPGSKTPVIGPLPVSLLDGVTYTGIAVNPAAQVSEGVILLDD